MSYRLLVSDVAGTLVSDDGVVLAAFESALRQTDAEGFAVHGKHWRGVAEETMGQSKQSVFLRILGSLELAERATAAFEASYRDHLELVRPIPGVEALLEECKEAGIAVFLTTGFSRTTLDAVIVHCGWDNFISGSVTPDEAGAGRPSPAMIRHAMHESSVAELERVVVVGDTESDILAGRASGAGLVVGVLSGAHTRETLEHAGADHVMPSIVSLRPFLGLGESA